MRKDQLTRVDFRERAILLMTGTIRIVVLISVPSNVGSSSN